MVILGLDPGSQVAGYGILEYKDHKTIHIDHGVIRLSSGLSLPKKLSILAQDLKQLINTYQVDQMMLEKAFMGKNVQSAFQLGHVRGVCFLVAEENHVQVREIAPRAAKKQVAGNGGASKEVLRAHVLGQLGINTDAPLDATDALALALCLVTQWQQEELLIKNGVNL